MCSTRVLLIIMSQLLPLLSSYWWGHDKFYSNADRCKREKNIKPFYFDFLLHTHRSLVLSCTKFCVCLHFPHYISPPSKCNKLLCWHNFSVLILLHAASSCPHCVTIFLLSFPPLSPPKALSLSDLWLLHPQYYLNSACFISFYCAFLLSSLFWEDILRNIWYLFSDMYGTVHVLEFLAHICFALQKKWNGGTCSISKHVLSWLSSCHVLSHYSIW